MKIHRMKLRTVVELQENIKRKISAVAPGVLMMATFCAHNMLKYRGVTHDKMY